MGINAGEFICINPCFLLNKIYTYPVGVGCGVHEVLPLSRQFQVYEAHNTSFIPRRDTAKDFVPKLHKPCIGYNS